MEEKPGEEQSQRVIKSSLLSGSSGSPDGPEQHVAAMNATFSAPCSLVPIDSCQVGAHYPVFLQQAYMLSPNRFPLSTIVLSSPLH
jgi:transcription initiation factor TFIIH subunit 3